jgi:hypothetical protein
MVGKYKVLLAELKQLILGKSRNLLAYVKRIGPAHQVLWKLYHDLRDVDWTVIDLDEAVGFDELYVRDRWLWLRLELHARHRASHQVEAPWSHLEIEVFDDAHYHIILRNKRTYARSTFR